MTIRSFVLALVATLALVEARAQAPAASLELVSVSPKDQLDFGRAALAELDNALKRVARLIEEAAKDGAAPEAQQCLAKKQASLKTLESVTQKSNALLKEALASNQTARADAEYRKLGVISSKVKQFLAEAETCVGGRGQSKGTTEVEVTSQALADAGDTAALTADDPIVGVDPPNSTPFE